MRFEIVGRITNATEIAAGPGVRVSAALRKAHGPGRWRKMKGIATVLLSNGQARRVELHWYEAHGVGRRDMKDQALRGRDMKKQIKPFAVCVDNTGNEASLILGKIYRVRRDLRAAKDDLLRIVDESGDAYLYDASQFILVDFPLPVRRRILALQRAS